MSVRGFSFKGKGRTVVTVFGILFILFVISGITIFTISRETRAQIFNDPGSYSYQASDTFTHFEIKVTHSTSEFINNDNTPITNPFYTISNVEISVFDSNSNLIGGERLSNGKISYKCYSDSVRLEVSEPTYCYKYQIDVIQHNFNPTLPILLTFVGYFIFALIASIMFVGLTSKRNPTSTNESTPNTDNIDTTNKRKIELEESKNLYEIVRRLPKKRICAISRTLIEPHDKALRCPFCRAYFIKEYLIGWLENEEDCPVCFRSLVEEK